MLASAVEYTLIGVGSFFLFVAGLGVFRLRDFFERIHAPTKASTLGLISLFGATVASLGGETATKALLAVVLIAATNPVGTHYLARTAHRCGIRPRGPGIRDDYAARREGEGPG